MVQDFSYDGKDLVYTQTIWRIGCVYIAWSQNRTDDLRITNFITSHNIQNTATPNSIKLNNLNTTWVLKSIAVFGYFLLGAAPFVHHKDSAI